MDNRRLKSEYDALCTDRRNVEGTWVTINKYVTPFRGEFMSEISQESAVNWHDNRELYDSTAVHAANVLASSLHGALTSPVTRWFDIVFKDDNLNRSGEASAWLDDCSNAVYQALQDSNFNLEANETYLDLVSYGSSVIVEEEETDYTGKFIGLAFQSVPIEECQFVQGHKGQLIRFYRRHKWTAAQIRDKFCKVEGDDLKLPQVIRDQLASNTGVLTKHDVLFCIYERDDKKQNAMSPKKLAPLERHFGFKYILKNSCDQLGEEGGYYEMPAFIPRWRKTNKSMWGNSPAMMALPDILTLNRLVELILKATEKVVDPATLVTERGLLSDLDLTAGGKTVVRTLDDIRAHESGARFDVSQLQRESLQSAIRSAFYVDQLELKQSPAMTATEVTVRYELMQRLLGPTLGRLESDYLDPMIQRTFSILYRAKRLPPVPADIAQAGAELDVTYVGPLARAQRTEVAQSVDRWISRVVNMSSVKPEVMDVPDWDSIVGEMARLDGVPPRLVKSASKVKQERTQREKAQAQSRQAAEQMAAGKGMEAVGKGAAAMQEAGIDPMEQEEEGMEDE